MRRPKQIGREGGGTSEGLKKGVHICHHLGDWHERARVKAEHCVTRNVVLGANVQSVGKSCGRYLHSHHRTGHGKQSTQTRRTSKPEPGPRDGGPEPTLTRAYVKCKARCFEHGREELQGQTIAPQIPCGTHGKQVARPHSQFEKPAAREGLARSTADAVRGLPYRPGRITLTSCGRGKGTAQLMISLSSE